MSIPNYLDSSNSNFSFMNVSNCGIFYLNYEFVM